MNRNRPTAARRAATPWACALGSAALALSALACGASNEPAPQAPAPTVTAPPEEPQAAEYATLDILCDPPTNILLDGKLIGKSPLTAHKVAPGKYDVTFADEETGNRTMTVEVGPGEGKTVQSDRPRTRVIDNVDDKGKKPKKP